MSNNPRSNESHPDPSKKVVDPVKPGDDKQAKPGDGMKDAGDTKGKPATPGNDKR